VKRPAAARGQTELGWLHSRHTFSFGGYFDGDQMGYRSLRVINDDVVEAGEGFGEHPHRDAEIFSYVIDGELEHKDSMGNGASSRPVTCNTLAPARRASQRVQSVATKPVHFLQIWLKPKMGGGEPRYAEKQMGQRGSRMTSRCCSPANRARAPWASAPTRTSTSQARRGQTAHAPDRVRPRAMAARHRGRRVGSGRIVKFR